jgi:serum/glucocorticoid-regulated kinase 2
LSRKILDDPLLFGPEIGTEARSILTGLLTRDPVRRLGANGADEIKKHPFFGRHIDFKKLLKKEIKAPFKPSVVSPVDVSNFDTVFTAEEAFDSVVEDSKLSQTVQDQFAGMSTFRLFIHSHADLVQASLMTARTCLPAPSNGLDQL